MYNQVMFWWRTTTQVVIGSIVAWLIARGLDITPEMRDAIEVAAFGLGIAVYAAVVHALEMAKGEGIVSRAARGIARLLMLGAPEKPKYVNTAETVR